MFVFAFCRKSFIIFIFHDDHWSDHAARHMYIGAGSFMFGSLGYLGTEREQYIRERYMIGHIRDTFPRHKVLHNNLLILISSNRLIELF